MLRKSFLLLLVAVLAIFVESYQPKAVESQAQIGRGRFQAPLRGLAMEAAVPITIRWELDNPPEVGYQDLSLSIDGGVTFPVAIASYLSPAQRQMTWSTLPRNASSHARLAITLHAVGGDVSRIVSDEFSISPGNRGQVPSTGTSAPPDGSPAANATIPPGAVSRTGVSLAADITNSSPPTSQTGGPDFPGTGSCATWNVPNVNLDYNLGEAYVKCGSPPFNGEPAVAQDPIDPTHFVLLHNSLEPHRSFEPNSGYGYSPQTKVGPFMQASGYALVGDCTTEITTDGSVYAVSMGISVGSPEPNAVILFRSTDGGLNFSSGVVLPKPTGVQFVDKPVMDVHKTNPNILAVTVNPEDSNGILTGNAYVVICTSATTLSNFTIVQPLDLNGNPVKPYGTLHPLIDPSPGSGSYWLFLVYTNDDFSGNGSRSPAGMTVFQYLVTGSTLGNGGYPINGLIRGLPGSPPLWSINPSYPSGSAVEKCLRVYDPRFPQRGNVGPANITKAAIDYCDPNAHRMYLPNLANANGVSSDLYLTVWQYSGVNQSIASIVTGEQEIYPSEKQKYVACSVTDGHGRVWVTTYIVGNTDTQRAPMAAIAIHRTSAVPGPIAYRSERLPINLVDAYDSINGTGLFLGDYVYTQATFYTFNGRSRVVYPTFMDVSFYCGFWEYDIGVSGWY